MHAVIMGRHRKGGEPGIHSRPVAMGSGLAASDLGLTRPLPTLQAFGEGREGGCAPRQQPVCSCASEQPSAYDFAEVDGRGKMAMTPQRWFNMIRALVAELLKHHIALVIRLGPVAQSPY